MSWLFYAVIILSGPSCPHDEPSCLTPTELIEVHYVTKAKLGRAA
jgi:hypothetical protein